MKEWFNKQGKYILYTVLWLVILIVCISCKENASCLFETILGWVGIVVCIVVMYLGWTWYNHNVDGSGNIKDKK